MNAETSVLVGKVALVTGATRGIGRAIALALAANGAHVIGTATTDEGARSITQALREFAGEGVRLDVRDSAAIEAALVAAAAEPTRRNVARTGRGAMLSTRQRRHIERIAEYYPGRDFSAIGIGRGAARGAA